MNVIKFYFVEKSSFNISDMSISKIYGVSTDRNQNCGWFGCMVIIDRTKHNTCGKHSAYEGFDSQCRRYSELYRKKAGILNGREIQHFFNQLSSAYNKCDSLEKQRDLLKYFVTMHFFCEEFAKLHPITPSSFFSKHLYGWPEQCFHPIWDKKLRTDVDNWIYNPNKHQVPSDQQLIERISKFHGNDWVTIIDNAVDQDWVMNNKKKFPSSRPEIFNNFALFYVLYKKGASEIFYKIVGEPEESKEETYERIKRSLLQTENADVREGALKRLVKFEP